MKEYKHRTLGWSAKQHVGSSVAGSYNYYEVIKQGDTNRQYIYKELIENSCDWQEVTQKDYTILTLVYVGPGKTLASYDKGEVGTYPNPMSKIYDTREDWIKAFLQYTYWAIYSVKRNSDGKIFTIGDKVKCWDGTKTIEIIYLYNSSSEPLRFGMVGQNIKNASSTNAAGGYTLSHIKKCDSLFKTEDGKDMYVGDPFWYVEEGVLKAGKAGNVYPYSKIKTFSTNEAAYEYMLYNEPLLSLNDLLKVWSVQRPPEYYKTSPLFQSFLRKAKSKL